MKKRKKRTARGVFSSSRRSSYLSVLSEHKVPSPVFRVKRILQGGKSAAGRGAKKDKKEKKAKRKARGVDWLLAPWCLLGCFVRTHSTVPCVPHFLRGMGNRPLSHLCSH